MKDVEALAPCAHVWEWISYEYIQCPNCKSVGIYANGEFLKTSTGFSILLNEDERNALLEARPKQ